MKTQLEMIEDVLIRHFGFTTGSSVTQAVTYAIFNEHCARLVNHMAAQEDFERAVSRETVLSAIQNVRTLLDRHAAVITAAAESD